MIELDNIDLAMVASIRAHVEQYSGGDGFQNVILSTAAGIKDGSLMPTKTQCGYTSPEKETADLLLQCYCIAMDNFCGAVFGNDSWVDFGPVSWKVCTERVEKWSKLARELPGISRWNMAHAADWPDDEFSLN